MVNNERPMSWPDWSPNVFGTHRADRHRLLSGALIIGGWAAIRAVRHRQRLRSKVEDAVDRHLEKLIALRAELLSYTRNGELSWRAWDEEIERFMHSQVAERVTPSEASVLEKRRDDMVRVIAARVARAAASPAEVLTTRDRTRPGIQ
jgi:hypothetical protein